MNNIKRYKILTECIINEDFSSKVYLGIINEDPYFNLSYNEFKDYIYEEYNSLNEGLKQAVSDFLSKRKEKKEKKKENSFGKMKSDLSKTTGNIENATNNVEKVTDDIAHMSNRVKNATDKINKKNLKRAAIGTAAAIGTYKIGKFAGKKIMEKNKRKKYEEWKAKKPEERQYITFSKWKDLGKPLDEAFIEGYYKALYDMDII